VLAVTEEDDDCAVGTFIGEWREIHVPGGGFQAHSRGTFVGAFADGTGALRHGTIEWVGTLHGRGAQIDYQIRFLSGTGTNELANLHGVGIASIDFSTMPPTNPMVWQIHWDP
jgi:hypothetical protein